MSPDDDSELKRAKAVAFHSTVLQAWVETRMERDKTLLTLASAGIGLLVTLLTAVGPSSVFMLGFYVLAGAAFVTAIIKTILVLDRNSKHLEDVLTTIGTCKLPHVDVLGTGTFRALPNGE